MAFSCFLDVCRAKGPDGLRNRYAFRMTLTLLALLLVQEKPKAPPAGPPWRTTWKAAQREAAREGKPIFAYFTKTY
jgi:hypothetical protein